jgi:hypothetical protein
MNLLQRVSSGAWAMAALAFMVTGCSPRSESSALSLAKEANLYVGEQIKDQVVQIHSEKSIGSLEPNVWYVVFYDPDATFKATEVKFGAGQKLEVTRPMRVLELGRGNHKPLDRSKLKVDSDRAIKTATAAPLLKSLKLTATQLWLQHGDLGPEWKVRLWAAKLRNPAEDADIGEIYIASDTGEIIRTDLHTNSVD